MPEPSAVLVVADTLRTHLLTPFGRCTCGAGDGVWEIDDEAPWTSHVAAAVVDALGGLGREEQWTPIQADGDRWQPRDKALALAALDLYGINGPAHFPDISPATTTHRNGALDKYCGQYRGPYSLEETA